MGKFIFVLLLVTHLVLSRECLAKDNIVSSEKPAIGMRWMDGAFPGTVETQGRWFWDENMKHEGIMSHTVAASELVNRHSFSTDSIVPVGSQTKIVQYLFLDEKVTPSGIMMKFMMEGDRQLAVYWEDDEEVFADMEEYIAAWYMGRLPESGRWIEAVVNLAEMDIAEDQIKGVEFIVYDGRVWWGETVIVQGEGGESGQERKKRQIKMAQ